MVDKSIQIWEDDGGFTPEIKPEPYRLRPFDHQRDGVKKLRKHKYFALFDEMGIGKTKQVIDAAQHLYLDKEIEQVLVISPQAVRSVWFDQEFGELAKLIWYYVPSRVVEYRKHLRYWDWEEELHDDKDNPPLRWVITNYEYIRGSEARQNELYDECSNKKTLLVLDESSAIKSHKAKQFRACLRLREACERVVLLNGTPIANHPGDLWTQGQVMDPSILECPTWYQFRDRYAVTGGFRGRQMVNWRWISDIQQRFEPHVLRRLKDDCLDLPKKMDPVTIEVPLTEQTWEIYKKMREELMVWLSEQERVMAPQAVVRILRLSQITNGFLGGIVDDDGAYTEPDEIGYEKLDFFLEWHKKFLEQNPQLKLVVWARFRAQIKQLISNISSKVEVGAIFGGQTENQRRLAMRLMDPSSAPLGPAVVVGNPRAGGFGLNLAAANHVMYISNDYSFLTRDQSADRVHRPGQTKPVSYYDVVATGPDGQKTIDHQIIRALKKKENLAETTTVAWLQKMEEEMAS